MHGFIVINSYPTFSAMPDLNTDISRRYLIIRIQNDDHYKQEAEKTFFNGERWRRDSNF
jgi:hypothetical protein